MILFTNLRDAWRLSGFATGRARSVVFVAYGLGAGYAVAGHPGVTQVSSGIYSFAGSEGATVPAALDHVFDIPVQQYTYTAPTFHGAGLPIGGSPLAVSRARRRTP